MFQSVFTAATSNMRKSVEKGSDWIIDFVIDHTNSISKYNPLVEVVI